MLTRQPPYSDLEGVCIINNTSYVIVLNLKFVTFLFFINGFIETVLTLIFSLLPIMNIPYLNVFSVATDASIVSDWQG